ncbi:MAG: XTP/dITP diphosphatase [Nitrospirae bacterium]|nr:MAG: XTP/dITP diphosphatase [Nitrospirota bacterium]
MKILIATRNKGKLKEFRSLLSDLGIDIVSIDDVFTDAPIVKEDGKTYEENALKKAETLYRFSSLPTVADDSGLEVEALNGAPGVFSARFAGEGLSDEENNRKLLSLLRDYPMEKRKARFKAVIAFVGPGIKKVFEGELRGHIAFEAAGKDGFGYDPIFIPEGYDKTLAQLGKEIKNSISHRAEALNKLKEFLKTIRN